MGAPPDTSGKEWRDKDDPLGLMTPHEKVALWQGRYWAAIACLSKFVQSDKDSATLIERLEPFVTADDMAYVDYTLTASN